MMARRHALMAGLFATSMALGGFHAAGADRDDEFLPDLQRAWVNDPIGLLNVRNCCAKLDGDGKQRVA